MRVIEFKKFYTKIFGFISILFISFFLGGGGWWGWSVCVFDSSLYMVDMQ